VAQLRGVLEPELFSGRGHLLLEGDHELLQLVLRHALDLALATPAAPRHGRRIAREQAGDVGDTVDDPPGGGAVLPVLMDQYPPRRSSRMIWIRSSVSISEWR